MSVCSVMHVSNVKTAGVIPTDPDLTQATARFCISEIRELQCGFPDTGAGSASQRERERAVLRLSVFSTIMTTEMADFVPSKTEFITKAWILTVINKFRNERQQSLLR